MGGASYITLATAAGQRFCGLHLDRVDGFGLSVLVLPRAWKNRPIVGDKPGLSRPLVHTSADVAAGGTYSRSAGGSATVILHEGEKVTLEVSSEVAAALVKHSERRRQEGRQEVLREASSESAPEHATQEERSEESREELDAAHEAKLRMLVRVSHAQDQNVTAWDSAHAKEVHECFSQGMLAMLELKHRLGNDQVVDHDLDASERWGGLVDTQGGEMDSALLLLAQWRFVEGMTRQVRRIRRGYVPAVSRDPVIRGRITQRGILQAEEGEVMVECAFDEFAEITPLYRILVTALDHVAMGAGATRYGFRTWSLWQHVQKDALQVRRQLSPIPSLPYAVAARRAGQQRLTARKPDWQPLLDLARALLRHDSPRGGAPRGVSCSFQWRINTAGLWEAWLRKAVGEWRDPSSGTGWMRAVDRGEPITPWEGLGSAKNVDLLVSDQREGASKRRCVVIDAKYKSPPITPSAADQYQILFYSLAYDNVCSAALVYPDMSRSLSSPEGASGTSETEGGTERGRNGTKYRRLVPKPVASGATPETSRSDPAPVHLQKLVLPFPPPPRASETPSAAGSSSVSDEAWDDALKTVGACLAGLFPDESQTSPQSGGADHEPPNA